MIIENEEIRSQKNQLSKDDRTNKLSEMKMK